MDLEADMAGIKELLRSEEDGSLSFGDHTLESKTKLENFKHQGDIYKVKTFKEMTRLEKNDTFLYESTPGTTVYNMKYTDDGVEFSIEGAEDAQITLDLNEDAEYEILVNKEAMGMMKTNISGKLSFGIELDNGVPVQVSIRQV
jgi:hypothetical protein